jgi:release factor family 11
VVLHTDVPTRAQIGRLLEARDPYSVSIYVPTDPVSDGSAERIAFGNLATEALNQLGELEVPRAQLEELREALEDLREEEEFWAAQARSLATFATPDSLVTFRLANRLSEMVEVSDRFYVKPLLRVQTFPQVAFVLALAQGSCRLVEVEPDMPASTVRVPDLPDDVASASRRSSISDRAPIRRIQGREGQKVRMRIYARKVDQALRPLLNGMQVPLVLAAAEPMASIYRSVNSYPHLADTVIAGNPEAATDAELAVRGREVLDELYATELAGVRDRYAVRANGGRGTSDVAEIARAATFGLVDVLMLDIDVAMTGTLDDTTGAVNAAPAGPDTYGILDEIARRVWHADGRVLAVRAEDIPGGGPAAAILRYAPFGSSG